MAGPVGAVAGAVIGAVAGGLGGKAAAEAVDPTVQDAYWEQNYKSRPYASSSGAYKDYQPAYRYGWESAARSPGRSFDEAAPDLEREWPARSNSTLPWEKARHATRDAWDRVSNSR